MTHRSESGLQGLAWDAGGRLWASGFGQNTFDKINLITPGDDRIVSLR